MFERSIQALRDGRGAEGRLRVDGSEDAIDALGRVGDVGEHRVVLRDAGVKKFGDAQQRAAVGGRHGDGRGGGGGRWRYRAGLCHYEDGRGGVRVIAPVGHLVIAQASVTGAHRFLGRFSGADYAHVVHLARDAVWKVFFRPSTLQNFLLFVAAPGVGHCLLRLVRYS